MLALFLFLSRYCLPVSVFLALFFFAFFVLFVLSFAILFFLFCFSLSPGLSTFGPCSISRVGVFGCNIYFFCWIYQ